MHAGAKAGGGNAAEGWAHHVQHEAGCCMARLGSSHTAAPLSAAEARLCPQPVLQQAPHPSMASLEGTHTLSQWRLGRCYTCGCAVGLDRCAVQSVGCKCHTAWVKQPTCVGASREGKTVLSGMTWRSLWSTQHSCFISWTHSCGDSGLSIRLVLCSAVAKSSSCLPRLCRQSQHSTLQFHSKCKKQVSFPHLTGRFCCSGQGGECSRKGRQAVGSSAVLGRQHAP